MRAMLVVAITVLVGCGDQPEGTAPRAMVPADAVLALQADRVVAAVPSGTDTRIGRVEGPTFLPSGRLQGKGSVMGIALVANATDLWVASTGCDGDLVGSGDDQRCADRQYVRIERTHDGGTSAETVFDSRRSGSGGLDAPRVPTPMWLSGSTLVALLTDDASGRSALLAVEGSQERWLGTFDRLRSACAARSGIYVVEASASDGDQGMAGVVVRRRAEGGWRAVAAPLVSAQPFDVRLGCTTESAVLIASESGRAELFDLGADGDVGPAVVLDGAVTPIEGPATGTVGLRSVSLANGGEPGVWSFSGSALRSIGFRPPLQPGDRVVMVDAGPSGVVTRAVVQRAEADTLELVAATT